MNSFRKISEVSMALVLTIGWILQALIIKDRVTEGMTWGQSIMVSFAYMTIWTNTLLCVTFWCLALEIKNKLTSFEFLNALVVYILIVGIVYHIVLASYWTPTGKLWYTDKIFHTISPIGMWLYWILFVPKRILSYASSLKWLWYPALYATTILVISLYTGQSPYPIFDWNKLSVTEVALNGTITMSTYWVMGMLIIFINNVAAKKFSNDVVYQ